MASWFWTQRQDIGPQPRLSHTMIYDSSKQKVVLFGGFGDNSGLFSDTWEWDGNEWTQVADTGPSRHLHSMAYDATRQRIVLFGGIDVAFPPPVLGDTWEMDDNQWKKVQNTGPGPIQSAAMVDSMKGIILFGGSSSNPIVLNGNTWQWDGKFWTQLQNMGPKARSFHSMAYDSQRGRMVLFGGAFPPNSRFGDTWELKTGSIPE
jgi:N-acetylneuraminic acid mutarotase